MTFVYWQAECKGYGIVLLFPYQFTIIIGRHVIGFATKD